MDRKFLYRISVKDLDKSVEFVRIGSSYPGLYRNLRMSSFIDPHKELIKSHGIGQKSGTAPLVRNCL